MKRTVRQTLNYCWQSAWREGCDLTSSPNIAQAVYSLLGGVTAVLLASCQSVPAFAQMPTLSEKNLGMERGLEAEFETYFDQNLVAVFRPSVPRQ